MSSPPSQTHTTAGQSKTFDSMHGIVGLPPLAMAVPACGGWNLQVCIVQDVHIVAKNRVAGALKQVTKDVFRRQYLPRNVHFCDDGASLLMTFIENHEV